MTVVVPTGNFAPLVAVHVGPVSGGAPPLALEAPKTTIAPEESAACTAFGAAGQEIVGTPGSTIVGVDGPPHAAAMTAKTTTPCVRRASSSSVNAFMIA